jgi:U1 small nuclear ribonucleoprotein
LFFTPPNLSPPRATTSPVAVARRLRVAEWKRGEAERVLAEAIAGWKPSEDPAAESDPFKTLIVANLSHETTEKRLRREFEEFGPIKRVRLVADKKGASPAAFPICFVCRRRELCSRRPAAAPAAVAAAAAATAAACWSPCGLPPSPPPS